MADALHIALVQVKATQTEATPRILSFDEEEECRRLVALVAETFRHSHRVPEAERQKPLIVSVGYAGVRVQDQNGQPVPTLVSASLLMARHPKDLPVDIKREVQQIHRAL